MEPVTTIFIGGFLSGFSAHGAGGILQFAGTCIVRRPALYLMYFPIIGARSFFVCSGTSGAWVMIAVASASLHAHVRGPPIPSTASPIVFCAVAAFCIRFALMTSTVTKSWAGRQPSYSVANAHVA